MCRIPNNYGFLKKGKFANKHCSYLQKIVLYFENFIRVFKKQETSSRLI